MSDNRHDYEGRDPRQPLPGEAPPASRHLFFQVGAAIVFIALGAMVSFAFAPETPSQASKHIAKLEGELAVAHSRIAELERSMRYKVGAESKVQGKLKPADRERHEREAKKYAKVLRMVKAQSASELMQWFVQRWDGLLDQPEENDRTTRRAE